VYGLNPLRRARQARGLTLQDVAERTKLSPRILLKIEMGEFGALPRGVQGRAHIRAYARAVGLDAEDVLRGLADRLPAEPDPVQSLRARARERFAEDHPVAAAIRDRAEVWQRSAIDLALSVPPLPARQGGGAWPYAAAGAIDAAVIAAFAGLMLLGATWVTETDIASVWREAPGPFVLSCGLMAALYFTVSRVLGGRTPGAAIASRLSRTAVDPAMLPRSFNGSPR
jgi:transcriptional regulator with XRE-family HTH domain